MWRAYQYVGCDFTSLPENENRIPGDSDIGGIGVIIAFVLTAWVTAVAATISFLREWDVIDYRFALGAEELLGPLCDLQAVTGGAIVIGGFSQWNTITFYHRELVLSYWSLTSISFWMARRTYMYEAVQKSETGSGDNISWTKWQVYTRRLLIIVSVFLGITWASFCNEIEDHGWDENDPRKCYHFNDITYKTSTTSWIWIIGLSIYQAALIFSFVDQKGTFPKRMEYQGDRLESFFKHRQEICSTKAADISCKSILDRSQRLLYGYFATAFFWIMFRLIQSSRVLITVWSYGDSDRRGFFLAYYALIIWDTWDIIMLKVMNDPLVEDETNMGFGQVLPLVLLIQIPLSMLDIWKDPAKRAERTRKEEIVKAPKGN